MCSTPDNNTPEHKTFAVFVHCSRSVSGKPHPRLSPSRVRSQPRRLTAALKLTRAYATGGQKSVHELYLTAA